MSDIELPADLIDLQKRIDETLAAESAHNREVEARRRELAPDPQRIVERRTAWALEEREEAERLSAEGLRLVMEKQHHPFMERARSDGTLELVDAALKQAARSPGPAR